MNLPNKFTEYTKRLMGEEPFSRFMDALNEEPPVSLRVNQAKCSMRPYGAERVAWCPYGYYLPQRPAFTFDPLMHAGLYYVQEASSMFLHHVIKELVDSDVRMLDMCAAPGGKSTTALGALPAGSVLVCNEPVRQRAQILAENIEKWGNPNVIVTNNYPHDYATSGLLFDIVLCDVPCSGEGMFRKDEGAVAEWSAQNVEKCRQLQRDIVADAWQCLRQDGLLVYSTCTFNAAENEDNVEWICREFGAELVSMDTDSDWGIHGSLSASVAGPIYRFIPGFTRGEGLFMAVMRKSDKPSFTTKTPSKQKGSSLKGMKSHPCNEWITPSEDFAIGSANGRYIAIPKALSQLYATASQQLRIVNAGVTLGTEKGRDIVPDQSLALSTCLRRGFFPEAELSYSDAIAYLRKEPVALPSTTPRGFVLVTYHGAPLGFEKNIGNRANNLYPQEWKIKSSHVPSENHETTIFKEQQR